MHRNRNPCNSFHMVKMASGMEHGRVGPTTTTTTSRNMAAIQLIPSLAVLDYSIYYIHTEIYTLKSRRVNFRSQTDVNQSNVAYSFSHVWEKRYVQSGAEYHVFSRVSRTASWSFHSRLVGAVSYTAQAIALRVWIEQIVFIRISSIVNIESSCLGETETERR